MRCEGLIAAWMCANDGTRLIRVDSFHNMANQALAACHVATILRRDVQSGKHGLQVSSNVEIQIRRILRFYAHKRGESPSAYIQRVQGAHVSALTHETANEVVIFVAKLDLIDHCIRRALTRRSVLLYLSRRACAIAQGAGGKQLHVRVQGATTEPNAGTFDSDSQKATAQTKKVVFVDHNFSI